MRILNLKYCIHSVFYVTKFRSDCLVCFFLIVSTSRLIFFCSSKFCNLYFFLVEIGNKSQILVKDIFYNFIPCFLLIKIELSIVKIHSAKCENRYYNSFLMLKR